MSFADKIAFVTGAAGGMGLAIARDLLAAGAAVALVDLKDEPADLPAGPGRALYLKGDVSDDGFVAEAVTRTARETGRLDYLVNAAGVLWFGRDRSLVDIEMHVWDRVLDINLKSAMLAARYAVPAMKRSGGGAMVHFSSIQCLRGDDRPQDAYQAAKAAIVAMSKSIAIQFARDRIRSNAILPGPTLTPMQARWEGHAETQAAIAGRIPLGRLGTAEDQANACLFLLSDEASWITGAELVVDGGLCALPG